MFRCRCIAARAPAASCAAIAFSTARCSAIAASHSAGRVVVMLELLVERPGALVPQHLDHGTSAPLPVASAIAQVEQPVADERLPARRRCSRCISSSAASIASHLRLACADFAASAAHSALDDVARAQELERTGRRFVRRPARRHACCRSPRARRCRTRCAPRPAPRPRARSAPRAPTAATRRAASRGRARAAAARPPETRRPDQRRGSGRRSAGRGGGARCSGTAWGRDRCPAKVRRRGIEGYPAPGNWSSGMTSWPGLRGQVKR